MIGCFINTVLVRTDLSGNPGFEELLRRVREQALGAYAHQELPFELLVRQLKPERYLSHNPLTQVMLVLLNAPAEVVKVKGLELAPVGVGGVAAQMDLTLHVMEERNGALRGALTYNGDLFEESTARRMMRSLERLIESAVAQPQGRIGELEMLGEEERQRIWQWNDSGREFEVGKCLHERIEEQARKNPGAVAVISGGQEISYEELNRRANRLGHELREQGVGVGSWWG